jgi:hypothetical protein
MAVKNFLKRNTINFLNYALILRRSVIFRSEIHNLPIAARRPALTMTILLAGAEYKV